MAKSKRKTPKKSRGKKRPRYQVDLFKIQKLLADVGWNETRYAEECGIAQPQLSRILSGTTKQPQQETLQKMAAPFKLLGGDLILPPERVQAPAAKSNLRVAV